MHLFWSSIVCGIIFLFLTSSWKGIIYEFNYNMGLLLIMDIVFFSWGCWTWHRKANKLLCMSNEFFPKDWDDSIFLITVAICTQYSDHKVWTPLYFIAVSVTAVDVWWLWWLNVILKVSWEIASLSKENACIVQTFVKLVCHCDLAQCYEHLLIQLSYLVFD